MAMLNSGAGLMFLIIALAVAILVSTLYITGNTHPDAGADGKTWILRQIHLETGAVRYVTTGTEDKEMALDVANRIQGYEPGWINTSIARGDMSTMANG